MENLSRTELEKKIGGLEAQIDDLRSAAASGNEVNLGEIEKLQDELDLLNEELDEIGRNDGDIDPKTEDEIIVIEEDDERQELENARLQEEQERNERENLEKEHEQQNEKDEMIENKETKELEEKEKLEEEIPQNDDERKLTLLDWQKESGVELLSDDAIKQKYDKFLTREEFMDVLDKENVPKIIREPGKAEEFLKSDADWRAVETSDSSLREAIDNGSIPTDIDNDDYIKRQYGDGKADVIDNDKDPGEKGYGKIDRDDVNEALEDREEDNKEEDKNRKEPNDFEEEIEEEENVSNALGEAMIDAAIGNVSKSEVDKVSATLSYMMRNPLKELANEIDGREEEYEITPPPGVRH